MQGEFVYNKDRYFQLSDLTQGDGVEKKNLLDYMLGADYTFFDKIDTNFQFLQTVVFNHDDQMLTDAVSTSFSVWLQTGFFDNKLQPELFLVSNLKEVDFMIRPRISYSFKGSWRFAFGLDIFEGDPDGFFGQFDEKDRVYVELGFIF